MSKKGTGKGSGTTTHYRRADNGQYVREQHAKSHPKTTVKETDKKK